MSTCDQELFGREGDLESIRRTYYVPIDPDDAEPEAKVIEWVEDNTPATISGFARANVQLKEYDELKNAFETDVEWTATAASPAPAPKPPAVVGALEFAFNYQARGGHRRQSLETLWGQSIYNRDYTDRFKRLVNVVNQDSDGPSDVEGYDASPGPETFTLSYYRANSDMTVAYINALQGLVGTINNADYQAAGIVWARGTLLLVRCQGTYRSEDDWQLDFGFSYKERVPERIWHTIKPVPPATEPTELKVPEHSAHHYEWAYVAMNIFEEFDDAKVLSPSPYAMFLERTWPDANFNALELPVDSIFEG